MKQPKFTRPQPLTQPSPHNSSLQTSFLTAPSFLKSILHGGTLGHKLTTPESFEEVRESNLITNMDELANLSTPGRVGKLAQGPQSGKYKSHYPKNSELKIPSNRGRLLHFFANHELLAIETMAFVLLRFPDADPAFRAGVLRTLQDEQRHLSLYIKRMQDFGVELGDFPLNLYFWNTLKKMRDPIDFVTQMSLTFEQANLDFAYYYANLFKTEIDDPETGKLLKDVHDDEIKHVAHGMKWFSEWRNPDESEYESFINHLPYPMTPRRARGTVYFARESRLAAGMSENFIESVRIAGGSRGKVPNYFFFNPQAELERVMPELPARLKQKADEMAPVMLWLASEEDVIELPQMPDLPFLTQAFNFKGALPEIVTQVPGPGRYAAFEEIKPWGWSQSAWKKMKALPAPTRKPPLFDSNLHTEKLFSKIFWKSALLKHAGGEENPSASLMEISEEVLIKISHSTSGRGHLRIPREQLSSLEIKNKIEKIKTRGDDVVIEPYYPKICDFSVQYELKPNGELLEFEPRFFKVDHLFQYRGSIIGNASALPGFEASAKLIDQSRDEIRNAHQPIIEILKKENYTGPFGVDALTYTEPRGSLKIKAIIEVNARYTMGRVAHEIERMGLRKNQKQGVFRILTSRDLPHFNVFSFKELEQKFKTDYPENFLALTPSSAKETWACVVFGEESVKLLS